MPPKKAPPKAHVKKPTKAASSKTKVKKVIPIKKSDDIENLKSIVTKSVAKCVRYTDDRRLIAAGFDNGNIILHEINSLNPEIILADDETKLQNNAVTSITYRNDRIRNTLTCSYYNGLIKKWNYMNGKCEYTIHEANRHLCGVVYHPKFPKLLSYGEDGRIFLYDEQTKLHEMTFSASEKTMLPGYTKLTCVVFNPQQPKEFVTGGWDFTVNFWDMRVKSPVRHISNVYLGGDGIAMNENGTEFVTCEMKQVNPIKLWNYATGKLIRIIQAPEKEKSVIKAVSIASSSSKKAKIPSKRIKKTPSKKSIKSKTNYQEPEQDPNVSRMFCGKYIANNLVATGGCDSNVFKVVNLNTCETMSFIENLPSGITHMDVTPHYNLLTNLPNIVLAGGNNIYKVEFHGGHNSAGSVSL